MTEAEIKYLKLNETFYLLTKQEEVCTSLSMLLSHVVDTLAGDIEKEKLTALSGSVTILNNVSKEIHSACLELEKLIDMI